jgi:hypothetical protein
MHIVRDFRVRVSGMFESQLCLCNFEVRDMHQKEVDIELSVRPSKANQNEDCYDFDLFVRGTLLISKSFESMEGRNLYAEMGTYEGHCNGSGRFL